MEVMKNKEIMVDSSSNVEREPNSMNSEAAMDIYLNSIGLYRKPVAKDGSCLFRAVAEKVYNTQAKHIDVRHECIRFMKANSECFKGFIPRSFEHHLFDLQSPKEWGGQVEITALSMLYKHDIIVYQEVNQPPQNVTDNGFTDKILLCFSNGNHYDSIYPISFKEDAAVVQSLLYNHLYNTVFPELEKTDEPAVSTSYADVGATIEGNGWADANSKSSRGQKESSKTDSSSLSWQIQRSLDPNVYRNIALEVWEQSKEDQAHSDRAIAAKLQFSIGEECLLRFPGAKSDEGSVKARIDSFAKESGFYNVFVPDYQEHYSVPIESLRPLISNPERALPVDYTELPGYYRKSEDFQYPRTKKQKGKNSVNNRDEEAKWKRADVRYDSKTEGKNEGRSESRSDTTQGYRRDNKRDRRGGSGGEKTKWDKNDRKGKLNEKSFRKDHPQRVFSPSAASQKSDTKSASEKKQDKTTHVEENSENVGLPTSTGYPSLHNQDKEKTAKSDESPAAFWGRMRKDKSVAPDGIKLKKANEVNPVQKKEDLNNLVDNLKPLHDVDNGKKVSVKEDIVSVKVDQKDTVRLSTINGDEGPADTESLNSINEIRDQKLSEKLNVESPQNIDATENFSSCLNLKDPEYNVSGLPLDSAPLDNVTKFQNCSSNELDFDSRGNVREDIDSLVVEVESGCSTISDLKSDTRQMNESSQDNRSLENHIVDKTVTTAQQQNTSSTPQIDEAVKNCPEITSPVFEAAIGASPFLVKNAVSFPTGFDEPVPASLGHFPSAGDMSSESPLTFMSSHSEISVSSKESGSNSNGLTDVSRSTSLTTDGTAPDVANKADITETRNDQKSEQKSEQKVLILRKDNKDQFVYFTPSNENSLSVETSGTHSRDRSPEHDTRKAQVKKVSFGNVTEISQVTATSEPFVANNVQTTAAEYSHGAYGSVNGTSEPQEQHFFGNNSSFDSQMGAPPQVMPVMMYPFPQPTEQIHIPQGYSVDPQGKDLPSHIQTVQYFFNLGLQYLYMQPPPQAFYNMPVQHVPSAPLPVQPQHLQNQTAPQIPQQRFPLDHTIQQFPQDQPEDFIAVSSAAPFTYDVMHQQSLNHVRQQHTSQTNSSQYEQPPRMRRGRGRASNIGSPMSMSRGYNMYNNSQQRQQHQFRLSKRNFPMNTGPHNQSFLYQ